MSTPNPAEQLSKRCVSLIRTALKPDLWPSKRRRGKGGREGGREEGREGGRGKRGMRL